MGSDGKRPRPRPRTSDITMPTGLDAILDGVASAPVLEAHVPLRPGERVGDREQFVVVEAIGRGGMSHVYLARDIQLGRRVALKVLTGTSEEARDLFEEEARKTAALQHPHIVTLHETGHHKGRPYLVLEHLRGETLADRLRRGPLPPREALVIAGQITAALHHAHLAGLVHRDLKPQNVFLVDGAFVKVLDFGIAALMHHAEHGAGTPVYMAPEQRTGSAVDARTDVWALGAVLYECLTGNLKMPAPVHPTHTVTVEMVKDPQRPIPAAIQTLLTRALQDRPEDRQPSAAALADEIERALIALATDVETPYRHLEAFGEEQAEWFLGRRRETARLRVAVGLHRVVVLAGGSGAGKASLLAAGLTPRLRAEGWNVVAVSPGRNPVQALAAAVRRAGGTVDEEAWRRFPGVAASALASLALARPDRGVDEARTAPPTRRRAEVVEEPTQQTLVTPVSVLIAVQNAEELVTRAPPAEARAFEIILAAACEVPAVDLRVVLTLRTDYLDRLASSPLLREDLSHIHLLDAPDASALRVALLEPARRLGFQFEEGLADDIVGAVVNERAPLPLLEFTASRLWEERDVERGVVPRAALARLGGVGGVLARHAESVYAALPTRAAQDAAQSILTRLVSADGSPREVERGEVLAGLGPESDGVLDTLARARVVSVGREVVRIGHESIARRWERLQRWAEDGAGDRAFRERVAEAARHWEAGGRRAGLLWGRDALGAGRFGAGAGTGTGGLGGRERAFLDACVRHARNQTRVRRAVLAGLAGLTLAAVVAAIYAGAARRDIEAAHARARSRELAGAAMDVIERDPELARALARRAVLREPTPEAVSALHAALRRNLPAREVTGFDGVTAMAFSPDGRTVVAGGGDGVLRVIADGAAAVELRGHEGPIQGVSVAADGRILSAGSDGTARIWAGGASVRTVAVGAETVYSAVFRPGSGQFLTASSDGVFRLFGADGVVAQGSIGDTNQVWHASFLPDGEHILTGYQPALAGRFLGVTPRVHDVRLFRANGTLVRTILKETDQHYSAASVTVVPGTPWRPSRLLVAEHPGPSRMLGLDGIEIARFEGHLGVVWLLVASADGKLVAGGSNDRTVRIWREDGQLVTVLRGHDGLVRSVAFHPDGAHVLTSSWDGLGRLFDREGQRVGTFAEGGSAIARLSPDGTQVVTAGPRSVRLWRTLPTPPGTVSIGGEPQVVAARDGRVYVVGRGATRVLDAALNEAGRWDGLFVRGVAPDGRTMVALSGPSLLRLELGPDGVSHTDTALDWPGGCSAGAVAVRGDVVVAGCPDGRVAVWTGAGPPAYTATLDAAVNAVLVHPRGYVAAASHTGRVHVWNVAGDQVCAIAAHDAPVWALAAVGDGFATGSSDKTGAVWDQNCARLATLTGHTGGIVHLTVSPDGERIVTGGWDGTARTWTVDGSPVARFVGHTDTVTWAGFSPDMTRFATTSGDDTARLWRTDGRPVAVLAGHTQGVLSGAFASGGTRFVTASRDGTAVSHITDVDELLGGVEARPFTDDELARYHLEE